jgi:hypothetical protein
MEAALFLRNVGELPRHCMASHPRKVFIVTAVRTTNPTRTYGVLSGMNTVKTVSYVAKEECGNSEQGRRRDLQN